MLAYMALMRPTSPKQLSAVCLLCSTHVVIMYIHVYMYVCSIADLEGKADFPSNKFLLCSENHWVPLLQALIIPLHNTIQTLQHCMKNRNKATYM